MKLKLFSIDFAKDTISFKVPHETMENTMWTGGYAHIDLSRISHTENESGVEADAESRCPECGEDEPDLHCSNCGHSWYRTA